MIPVPLSIKKNFICPACDYITDVKMSAVIHVRAEHGMTLGEAIRSVKLSTACGKVAGPPTRRVGKGHANPDE